MRILDQARGAAFEAALKEEAARLAAEVEAARAQVVKTVASIPKASERSSIRPAAPPIEDLDSDLAEVLGSGNVHSAIGMPSLIADFVCAAVAIASTFLILQEMNFILN